MNCRSVTATFLLRCCFAAFVFGGQTGFTQDRTWVNNTGKKLEASLVSADKTSVILKLKSGSEAAVPRDQLSAADQKHLNQLEQKGLTFVVGEMPSETQTPRTIEVEGGPRVFRTPHFEFETDQNVSKAFISEAARVYEGTYLAIQGLPLGLKLSPPEGATHYRGLFVNDRNFVSQLGDSIPSVPGQRVAGVYMPKRRKLLVPYSSLGAKENGSQMTLRRSSDTSTLIHEITHQVMHDWLPFIPVWFAEGMSEYISAVPYQNGRFEFVNAQRGLEERLASKYRVKEGGWIEMTRPSKIIAGTPAVVPFKSAPFPKPRNPTDLAKPSIQTPEWRGTILEYRNAMLLTYYFIHLDRKEAPAAPVAAYLKLVDHARNETDTFIAEYNQEVDQFEAKRNSYNKAVGNYNDDLEAYRLKVNGYNSKVKLLNQQILEGVPEVDRTDIGKPPEEPVAPKVLVVPDMLKKPSTSGPIDIVSIVQERANHALFRGRSPQQLDAAVVAAFAEIGITLDLQD